MGHIKEPKGVDFVISSEPLTDMARKEITAFINNYKKDAITDKVNPQAKLTKLKKEVAHL